MVDEKIFINFFIKLFIKPYTKQKLPRYEFIWGAILWMACYFDLSFKKKQDIPALSRMIKDGHRLGSFQRPIYI